MSTPFRIGVVLSPRGWSTRLHAFVADHVPDVELIVVRDRRASLDALAHVLVLDGTTPWLTPAFVVDAEQVGLRLVGVYDRGDGGASRDRLAALGLAHLLEEAMPPEDVVFLLDRLRPTADMDRRSPTRVEYAYPEVEGAVVAVGGPSGSGAREFAVGLAAHWAEADHATLLVDANETTPGVARRLGLGLYPHLLTAIDGCRSDGLAGIEAALADQVTPLPFDVIVGLATPRDWDRLVPHDLGRLLATCAAAWERVVVATGPLIEDLQRWGDRFAMSRRVLAAADVVVGTCEPNPRGVLRYLDWITDATHLASDIVTVLNKVPASRRVAWEAASQIVDVGGALVDDVIEVPFDRAVTAAEWDGRLVTRGRYWKAVAAVASEVDVRISPRLRAGVTA
jgi:CO dehydrogenase nickel-insertion accessory protein CooC1